MPLFLKHRGFTGLALALVGVGVLVCVGGAHAESGSARSVHFLASPAARTASCSFGWLVGMSFGPTYEDAAQTPASAAADISIVVPWEATTSNFVDLVLALSIFFHPSEDFYLGPRAGIFSTMSSAPLPVFHGGLAARYYLAPIFYMEATGGVSAAGNYFAIAQIGFAPF